MQLDLTTLPSSAHTDEDETAETRHVHVQEECICCGAKLEEAVDKAELVDVHFLPFAVKPYSGRVNQVQVHFDSLISVNQSKQEEEEKEEEKEKEEEEEEEVKAKEPPAKKVRKENVNIRDTQESGHEMITYFRGRKLFGAPFSIPEGYSLRIFMESSGVALGKTESLAKHPKNEAVDHHDGNEDATLTHRDNHVASQLKCFAPEYDLAPKYWIHDNETNSDMDGIPRALQWISVAKDVHAHVLDIELERVKSKYKL